MPFRYAALQNPSTSPDRELEASFDSSDSDIEEDRSIEESLPLNSSRNVSPPPSNSRSNGPTPYNFENLDYDYPPPGSPPRPSALALPNNNIGNSNGQLPQSPQVPLRPHPGWIRRTAAAILPSQLLGESSRPSRMVGGGIENDGVFANINAKPGRGRVVEDGESGIHVVPEEVQKETPPSYASAQADAVPPYWETTILAPTSLSSAGEMMVDGLPTGSFFSFLWNLLVSMSFQFVGFLLTFLLHSTHAAKLGSRAGLGITLIHFGFYLRTRSSYAGGTGFLSDPDEESLWNWPTSTGPNSPKPTFGAADAEGFYTGNDVAPNTTADTIPPFPPVTIRPMISEGTAEWLSFLLMTVGWFILLTSTLSFWRVKRWERSIIASAPIEPSVDEAPSHAHNPFYALERFGFPGAMWRGGNSGTSPRINPEHDEEAVLESNGEHHPMLPHDTMLQRAGQMARAEVSDRRLQQDLRAAGLI